MLQTSFLPDNQQQATLLNENESLIVSMTG